METIWTPRPTLKTCRRSSLYNDLRLKLDDPDVRLTFGVNAALYVSLWSLILLGLVKLKQRLHMQLLGGLLMSFVVLFCRSQSTVETGTLRQTDRESSTPLLALDWICTLCVHQGVTLTAAECPDFPDICSSDVFTFINQKPQSSFECQCFIPFDFSLVVSPWGSVMLRKKNQYEESFCKTSLVSVLLPEISFELRIISFLFRFKNELFL